MNFDQLGQAWRDENEAAATAPQRDELIAQTCRKVERFWSTIVGRDLRESVVAIALMPIFGWMAWDPTNEPLERVGAGVIVAACGFIVYWMHRARRSTPPPPIDAPLRDYCDTELVRVEKQIKLLESVLVWYIAPITGGLTLMSFGRYGWSLPFLCELALYAFLTWGLHVLNQLAVRSGLVPLRDQVQALRDGLDRTDGDLAPPAPPSTITPEAARRIGWRLFWVFLSIGVGGIVYFASTDIDYPKRSPFDAVRWRGEDPEVRLDHEWYELDAINGQSVEELRRFTRWTFGGPRWKKRFEEDLFEILARKGHRPGYRVELTVTPVGATEQQVLEDIPMSEEKRWVIYRAGATREEAGLPRFETTD